MIALNHRLTLEMTMLNSQASVRIKKNDTKNKLVISLSEHGKLYTLTENMHAAFVGKKPDGKIVFNDCDIVGNTITYTITAQTSVAVGIVDCEIRLYDANNNLLTSPTFTIVVDEIIYNADDIQTESENEINVLDSLISEARKLIDEVEKSKLGFVSYGTTTHAEIYEAYRNNKTVFCRMRQAIYPLMSFSADEAYFTGMSISGKPIVVRCEAPNTWSFSTIDVGGAGTFIAEYDVTPFADIAAAVESGKIVYCKATNNGESFFIPLTTYAEDIARFVLTYSYQSQVTEITLVTYNIFVGADDYWDYDDWNHVAKINYGERADGTADAVQYVPQELTEQQQAQARTNIGAISLNNIPGWARNSNKPSYTASEVGADASGTADNKVGFHNVDDEAHNDIRIELKALADRIAAVLDSDDSTLDELSEIVAYIKANKTLIDSITTSKVNVADIINNLTSNVTNKPLSAAQGVVLKALIDAIIVPTKVSELTNDKGYLTSFTESDPNVPAWAKQSTKPSYTKSEVGLGNVDNVKQYSANNPPPYPVTKVNGKTGDVVLDAESVGARADTWLPTPSDIGAEKSGTASSAVNAHNTNETAHNDIRLLIEGLTTRLNALANSTDEDLDQMAEVVAYIKSNKQLIDSITTSKVSVADIVNNLTTNVSNKPLSAAQGVALKALIDAISVPTKLSELAEDTTHRVVTDAEKTAWNAKSNFSGAYDDLTGKPTIPTVPTKVSAFENDKGYLTSFTESDPTVPAWAKATSKPSYSKSEVGLGNVDNVKQYSASNPPPYPVTSVNGQTGVVTVAVPTKTSELTNDSGYLTQHQSLSGYAKTTDHYTKTESDNKYQPKGNYLTSVPSEYVTETELNAKGYLTLSSLPKYSGGVS